MGKEKAAQNQAALAALRSLAPGGAPGAFAPNRVHGRYAVATIGSVTLLLFDWEVTFNLETFNATAHGERWRVLVPGDQSWSGRAQGYFVATTAAYLAAAANSSADPGTVLFTGYANMKTTAGTGLTIVWQGDCLLTRANLSVPMAMVTQEFEFEGTGVPTAGT